MSSNSQIYMHILFNMRLKWFAAVSFKVFCGGRIEREVPGKLSRAIPSIEKEHKRLFEWQI